jgi:hypothetical protein
MGCLLDETRGYLLQQHANSTRMNRAKHTFRSGVVVLAHWKAPGPNSVGRLGLVNPLITWFQRPPNSKGPQNEAQENPDRGHQPPNPTRRDDRIYTTGWGFVQAPLPYPGLATAGTVLARRGSCAWAAMGRNGTRCICGPYGEAPAAALGSRRKTSTHGVAWG